MSDKQQETAEQNTRLRQQQRPANLPPGLRVVKPFKFEGSTVPVGRVLNAADPVVAELHGLYPEFFEPAG